MALFLNWLTFRDVAFQLDLLESAEYFDPQAYNPVFNGELEKLLNRINDPDLRRQVSGLKGFDWAGYLVHSLARAGYKGGELEETFQSICVILLVTSKLFRGWQPQRHGPLDRRFRRSVWNGIRNAQQKTRNRMKWMTAVDPAVMAGQFAGRAPYSDLIDQFRQLVAQRLGKGALEILDQKLSGEDANKMIGKAEFGTPSAYLIKREIRGIKQLAHEFAQQTGDAAFLRLVNQGFAAQSATAAKRQAAVAAK